MAKTNVTRLCADVQEALIDEPDFLAGILQDVLQEILEAEMTEHLKTEPHQRTAISPGISGTSSRPATYPPP